MENSSQKKEKLLYVIALVHTLMVRIKLRHIPRQFFYEKLNLIPKKLSKSKTYKKSWCILGGDFFMSV